MTDTSSEAAAAAPAGDGAAPAADPAAVVAQSAAPQPREWMAGLPEDLRNDATLSRYESPEALARGHLEARRLASSRVIVPGKDADDATRNAFYSAIGRPETAEGYQFETSDSDTARAAAGAFGKFAFGVGMPKEMAEAAVKWDNERQAEQLKAYQDQSAASFNAWKADKPDADARISRIGDVFKKFGVGEMDAAQIEARLGTKEMFDLFDKIASSTTEHGRVDGERSADPAPQAVDPDKAFSERMKDEAFRAKLNAGDVDAKREYDQMVQARRDAAAARQKGR